MERRTGMLNKIMLIGNLGKDPDMNVTTEGTPFTRFSLAVNRRSKSSSGERQDETEWFNVVAWRQLAEVCNTYLTEGSKVYIEGRVQQRKYTGKDGVERMAFDVIAREVEFLSGKQQGSTEADLGEEFP